MKMEVPRGSRSIATSGTATETVNIDKPDAAEAPPVLRLRLQKPRKKCVGWTEGTVDNEHMNKKKSKCCCIYKKPVAFGESSSEDDEDCEHCFGHPEKRRKNFKHHENDEQPLISDENSVKESQQSETVSSEIVTDDNTKTPNDENGKGDTEPKKNPDSKDSRQPPSERE